MQGEGKVAEPTFNAACGHWMRETPHIQLEAASQANHSKRQQVSGNSGRLLIMGGVKGLIITFRGTVAVAWQF